MTVYTHAPETSQKSPATPSTDATSSESGGRPQPPAFTPEQRAKSRATRTANAAARAASTLRHDFLDDPNWVALAHRYGVHLPLWGMPCTPGQMRRWLRTLGFSGAWYREWCGFHSLQEWIDANRLWPLRSFAGLLLEERESEDWHKEVSDGESDGQCVGRRDPDVRVRVPGRADAVRCGSDTHLDTALVVVA